MRQQDLDAYLQTNCPDAWQAVQTGGYATAHPHLTTAEKAAIYHYTDQGYETLNAALHASDGANNRLLGKGLAAALNKLPPYQGPAQSGAWLSPAELLLYRTCCLAETPVRWPAFLSASTKPGVAMMFLRQPDKNCLFVIQSKTGRLVEAVSKFGLHGRAPGQNEGEVLFAPGTAFDVLAVTDETDHKRIVLDER